MSASSIRYEPGTPEVTAILGAALVAPHPETAKHQMNYLRQEKSLRDHESNLNRFAVIMDRNRSRRERLWRIAPFVHRSPVRGYPASEATREALRKLASRLDQHSRDQRGYHTEHPTRCRIPRGAKSTRAPPCPVLHHLAFGAAELMKPTAFRGRYWDRTSDLPRVRRTLSR
jgi:hypothetical protein